MAGTNDNAADLLGSLGDVFSGAMQGRMDWIEEIAPHPAGWVKLTKRQQVTNYAQLGPEQHQAIIAERGMVEYQEYIQDMERSRERLGM